MRMGMRRFTRQTNAFSKRVENLAHAVSLLYMHYNFARPPPARPPAPDTDPAVRQADHPGDGGWQGRSRQVGLGDCRPLGRDLLTALVDQAGHRRVERLVGCRRQDSANDTVRESLAKHRPQGVDSDHPDENRASGIRNVALGDIRCSILVVEQGFVDRVWDELSRLGLSDRGPQLA